MLLTIDIGNSNIVLAIYTAHKERVYDARFETLKLNPELAYAQWIQEILVPLKDKYHLSDFILSSVVPSITDIFYTLTQSYLSLSGMNCTLNLTPQFKILLDNPNELGADFIATSFGALAKYSLPILIADMGSATKVSALNTEGEFAGGVIMTGLKVSQDALYQFIPHLPVIPMEIPKHVLGTDTVSAMQSGLMFSSIDTILGISHRIDEQFGQTCVKILTGGLANLIHHALPDFHFEPFLLNEGLFEIYRRNQAKKPLL